MESRELKSCRKAVRPQRSPRSQRSQLHLDGIFKANFYRRSFIRYAQDTSPSKLPIGIAYITHAKLNRATELRTTEPNFLLPRHRYIERWILKLYSELEAF